MKLIKCPKLVCKACPAYCTGRANGIAVVSTDRRGCSSVMQAISCRGVLASHAESGDKKNDSDEAWDESTRRGPSHNGNQNSNNQKNARDDHQTETRKAAFYGHIGHIAILSATDGHCETISGAMKLTRDRQTLAYERRRNIAPRARTALFCNDFNSRLQSDCLSVSRTCTGLLFPLSPQPAGDHFSTRSAARKGNLDRAVRGARQVTCLLLGAFTGARLLWKP